MRKVLLLTIAGVLALPATATAQEHKLTIHRAKVEIRREAIWALDAHANYVTVGHCQRTSNRRVLCTMRYAAEGPACVSTERWSAILAQDGSFTNTLPLPNARLSTSGECASVSIAPVDGQPTYDPPPN